MNKSQEITNLLKATLNKMTLEGIDRVVLQINVSPEELCRGNNIPSYYPNEALTQEELTLIEQQKEYEIVSLVTGRIRNVQVNKNES